MVYRTCRRCTECIYCTSTVFGPHHHAFISAAPTVAERKVCPSSNNLAVSSPAPRTSSLSSKHMAKKKATKAARPTQEGAMETPKRRSKRAKLVSQVKMEEAARPDAVASAVTPDSAASYSDAAAFTRPTPEECQWTVTVLSEIHPEVVENNMGRRNVTQSCGAQDNIVDGVVSTMLSQNTTSANSTAAFRNLKQAFPTWEEYIETADSVAKLEEAIRCGGLAEQKSKRIHEMLTTLQEERGSPSLEYLRHLSNEEIKRELSRFKGLDQRRYPASYFSLWEEMKCRLTLTYIAFPRKLDGYQQPQMQRMLIII